MTEITVHEALRLLAREAADLANATLRDHDLTYIQYLTLGAIATHGPIDAAAVGRRIWVATASAAGAAATLRGRGYITRDETGGMSKPLLITQPGLAALTACDRRMAKIDSELMRFINEDTADALMAASIKLRGWYDMPV